MAKDHEIVVAAIEKVEGDFAGALDLFGRVYKALTSQPGEAEERPVRIQAKVPVTRRIPQSTQSTEKPQRIQLVAKVVPDKAGAIVAREVKK